MLPKWKTEVLWYKNVWLSYYKNWVTMVLNSTGYFYIYILLFYIKSHVLPEIRFIGFSKNSFSVLQ